MYYTHTHIYIKLNTQMFFMPRMLIWNYLQRLPFQIDLDIVKNDVPNCTAN